MNRSDLNQCRAKGHSGKREIFGWIARRALCLLALLLLPLTGASAFQADAWEGAGYSAVLYDSSNGLPTSAANAVVQSSEGFLWIGGYSGLLRYDGNTFYRYDSSTGVSSVVSLFEDSRGRLWIGTNDSGVCRLENEQFTFYDREEGLRSSSVRSITEDPDGNLLIATTMGMVYIDPEDTMHVLDDPQINQEYVCELVPGQDGAIYGVTLSGAFFTVRNLRVDAFYDAEFLGLGVINTILPDPERPGFLYLGTQNSTVIHGDLSNGMADRRVISVAPLNQVNSIRVIDGTTWLCSDTGIGCLDENFQYTQLHDLPMTNSIDHIMSDYEGNLWFTSSRQGVMKIVPNRFTDIFSLAKLPPRVVNSTCIHGDYLYVGTDTGLLLLDRTFSSVENEMTELLQGVRIRCIRADSTGALWFCTNSDYGLIRYDAESGAYLSYNTQNGLASNRARMILELSDGTIAVATNAGVNLIRDGEIVATYNNAQGISNMEVLCIEEGTDGRLYFGSDGDGIYVAEDGKISRVGRDDGLTSEVILRLRRDPEDPELFWIITSNSIAYMRGGHVTPIRNFPYSNNFDLYFDNSGRVWVLSSNGIYVVKRAELLRDGKIDYTLYDTKSGLPCAATANSYSYVTEEGNLYLSASNGVSSVNIFDTTDDARNVRLAVPFLIADDAYLPVPEDGQVRVPAQCRRLNIHPYAFTYTLNNPHVRYALEGFDETPAEVTRQELDAVSYTNLPGGTYTFRLSALDTMTGEESQTLSVTIVKEKTIYEQTWFWILLSILGALLAAGAVALYFRHKTKVLLRKQEENRLFINELASAFASCIDMKDHYTNGHSHRVAKYTAMFARRMGRSKEETENIYNIALLHDVGKISIPDSVLNKPGKLTDEEFAIIKSHSARGYEILKEISIAPDLALGAGYHHERLDGKGYPNGLSGDEIPEIAQMIAVADTFDAMYSTRPYRKKLPLETVVAEIQRIAGTQLSPKVVDVFLELVREGAFDDE